MNSILKEIPTTASNEEGNPRRKQIDVRDILYNNKT